MKLSVAAVILAIITLPVTSVAQHSVEQKSTQSARHNNNRQNTQSDSPKAVPAQGIPLQAPATEERDESIYTNDAKPDWWARISNLIMAFATIALAAVGAIAACAAIKTLRAIQHQGLIMIRQTRVLQRQARATEDSVKALIASERAYVDAELVEVTIFGVSRYALKITNHGKTPARMLDFDIRCGCLLEGTEFVKEKLAQRHYGKFHFLLGADKSRTLTEDAPLLNMFETFGGCLDAGAYCVTIQYADVITNGDKTVPNETSFIYYCRFLTNSLERISEYDKYS